MHYLKYLITVNKKKKNCTYLYLDYYYLDHFNSICCGKSIKFNSSQRQGLFLSNYLR